MFYVMYFKHNVWHIENTKMLVVLMKVLIVVGIQKAINDLVTYYCERTLLQTGFLTCVEY